MTQIGDQAPPRSATRRAVATGSAALCLALTLGACTPGNAQHPAGPPTYGAPSSRPAAAASAPETDPPSTQPPLHFESVRVRPATKHAVHRATVAYFVASNQALADPRAKLEHASAIRGAARQSLIAMRTEYASKHYRVVGQPFVVSEKIIKRQVRPTELVVAACVDSSRVRVLDRDGREVPGPGAPARSLNLFTLERRAGHWSVVGSSFPSDPNC